ncbi:MAG: RraA family protein [Planctomycetales bacterium]|nr:RraA family protein [Planctomycetales bacterium]
MYCDAFVYPTNRQRPHSRIDSLKAISIKELVVEITIAMMRASLYSAVVCDALDAVGLRNQSPRVRLTPYACDEVLVGRCATTLWTDMYHEVPNPYELELESVDSCQSDDVMICAANGSMHSALWGELLSTAARNAGCVGTIIDGAVRDVAKIRRMNFPVFARGTSPYDSQNRQRVIDFNVPVEIAGVRFSPGDLLFADIDGIVVVPQEVESEVIDRAWDKVHQENQVRDAIQSGMRATEAYDQFGIL